MATAMQRHSEIPWPCISKTFYSEQRMLKSKLKIQPKPKGKEIQKGINQSCTDSTVTKFSNSGFGQNPRFSKGKRVLGEISDVTDMDHREGVNRANYQKRQKINNVKPVPTTTASYVSPSCGSVNRPGSRPTDFSRDLNVDSTGMFSSKDDRHNFHPATPTIGDARGKNKVTIDYDAQAQISPKKALRVAMLKSRFADIILKAKNELLYKCEEKGASLEMHHEKELSTMKQKEAKIRVAAEVASKKRQQAKLKSQREREREAARIALENMVKTAEIYECEDIMRDYEILIARQPRINLGLVLKSEYIITEEEEYLYGDDVEEGEIIF